MNGARFPPELAEMVIDELRNNTKALATCGLVCKAWLRRVRHYLFDEDVLNTDDIRKIVKEGLEVVPLIRRLGFKCNKNVQFWNAFLQRPIATSNVQSFCIRSVRWYSLGLKTQMAIVQNFAAVVRLEFVDVAIAAFSQLPTIICSFSNLETLVIEDMRWPTVDIVSPTLRLPPNFRAVEFKGAGTECILRWLSSFQIIDSLATIYLHNAYPYPSEADAFFKMLGPSLETLFCDLRQYHGQAWHPNLSHNRNLRTLHLRLPISDTDNTMEGTQCITRTLSQIVSARVNKVIVEYDQEPYDQPEHEHWAQVDAALVKPQFSGLNEVEILTVCGSSLTERQKLQAWFTAKLPQCHASGILHVLRTAVCQGTHL